MNGNRCKLSALILSLCIVVTLSSCVRTIVQPVLPCPPRPILEPLSVEEQADMHPMTVFKVAENQLRLKAYAKKLETRAGCEAP